MPPPNRLGDHLIVSDVSKRFGASSVLEGVDIAIGRGELVTLLGPSGCGKTTLLRIIAGLVTPDSGRVAIAGRDVTRIPPHRRNVGVVFQNYALFPHLTVAGNVAFGLKVRGRSRAEIDAAVTRALALVRLDGLAGRPVSALSGGQQQRVAVARAIAVEPEVLLFDEALSALDRKLREAMQVELRLLLREIGVTAIFVTHDQNEALTMSDRVAVMNRGRIEQCADPRTIYARPATLFALSFVGLSSRLRGKVVGARNGVVEVETPAGRLAAQGQFIVGAPVVVATRPENLRPSAVDASPHNSVAGRVGVVVFHGSHTLVEVEVGGGAPLLAEFASQAEPPVTGASIRVHWPVGESFAYPDPEAAP